MGTSIIATPATAAPQVPQWLVLNEFFDHPLFLGFPIWFFILIFFIFVFAMVNASWILKMRRLAAVRGFRDIQKKMTQEDVMTWIIGKTQRLTIEALRYIDSIISYRDPAKITKWHLNTPLSVVHIGGFPGVLVSDDYDQTRDIVSEIALCHACDEFNRDQTWWAKMREEIHKRGMKLPDDLDKDEVAEPIESFSDYRERGRFLLGMKYPEGIPIPAYSIFNPVKFRRYFPKGRSSGLMGGVFLRKSRKLQLRIPEKGFWDKALPLGLVIGVGLVMIIAAWMVPLGAH